jgi:uncharacterized membrane protein YkvA (DUF1232 family)
MRTAPAMDRLDRLKVDCLALYLAMGDPRVPWTAKALAALVAGYAFSPVDLIPDFIPVVGLLDDLVILPGGLWLARRLIPEAVMRDLRARAAARMDQARPRFWLAAAVILLIWLALAALAARWALS